MFSQVFNIRTHLLPCQYIREYPAATAEGQEDTLQLHIKQYTPKVEEKLVFGAITIIGAHANGFPKELYEPLWEDLYERLKMLGLSIRSIWMADVAHQGTSSVVNEGSLGNDPSWFDHSRDLLHMINHFRKEMPRPLVGIGHSMGGTQLAYLSIMHPRLLSSIILIDPIIQLESVTSPPGSHSLAQLSTFRRDIWPSREDAIIFFKKSSFYQLWDERVLNCWITYGLRDLPTAIYPESPFPASSSTPVTLTTPKHQEVFTFLRPNFKGIDSSENPTINRQTHPDMEDGEGTYPFYRPEPSIVFRSLPHLRPSALWIFGSESFISRPTLRQQKMATTGTGLGGNGGAQNGRVHEVVLPGVGHLIPMAAARECAHAAANWLAPEMRRWRDEDEEFRKAWAAVGKTEKMTVSDEWKRQLGGDPRTKPPRL